MIYTCIAFSLPVFNYKSITTLHLKNTYYILLWKNNYGDLLLSNQVKEINRRYICLLIKIVQHWKIKIEWKVLKLNVELIIN